MPRPSKPARLWLRPARKAKNGNSVKQAVYLILDAGKQISTGCGPDDRRGAEEAISRYIAEKTRQETTRSTRRKTAEELSIAVVLARYMEVKGTKVARPNELGQRVKRLLEFWTDRTCDHISSVTCNDYVAFRSGKVWASATDASNPRPRKTTTAGARRELEDLRAAIGLATADGILSEPVRVFLPPENPNREEWLTEEEVEHLCQIARDTREVQTVHKGARKGQKVETRKKPLAHVERFIRVAVMTGTRSSAICQASFEREPDRPWIDLENGLFYRKAPGRAEHRNKKYPTIPLAPALVEEMIEWRDSGAQYVVEFNGKPANCRKSFERLIRLAKLDKHVVRHTLRHTAATWMMQEGVDLAEAAGYLGMSLETLQKRYAHHHPDYQKTAASKLAERANRARTDAKRANDWPMKQGEQT
ncbi:integrase [Roseibium alexandrii]|uniref:Integrase n=1 Tax=Roseibium alexandrii TaxID=388408 RepID=A0A0M7AD40_9HYPH|nr:integrase [Roseibium alexandrii]